MITTNIYLLRHGKVDGLPALYGHTDIAVTDSINNNMLQQLNTWQQNTQQKITHVVSSPLQRCNTLATTFATENKLTLTTEQAFSEMYFGVLDGVSFDEINESHQYKNTWQKLELFWQNPEAYPLPEAETLHAFYLRVKNAWQQLLHQHQGNNVLLVCHGGVIRMILSLLLNINYTNQALFSQLNIKNSSVTCIKNMQNGGNEKNNNNKLNTQPNSLNKTQKIQHHNSVTCIATPLKCIAHYPEEF